MACCGKNKIAFDPEAVTDPKAAADLYINSIRESVAVDAFKGKTRFNAIVLTDPEEVPVGYYAYSDDDNDSNATAELYKFRARIVDNPSPHAIYPIPCNAADPSPKERKIIRLHTEFYSTAASIPGKPTIGNMVIVELSPMNEFGYNLVSGEYIGKIDNALVINNIDETDISCQQPLSGEFDNVTETPPPSTLDTPLIEATWSVEHATGKIEYLSSKSNKYKIRYNRLKQNTTDFMADEVRERFDQFLKDLKENGYAYIINSVRRSPKHQLYLSLSADGALPCHSDHQYGFAMDMNIKGPGMKKHCLKKPYFGDQNIACWQTLWTGIPTPTPTGEPGDDPENPIKEIQYYTDYEKPEMTLRQIADKNQITWAAWVTAGWTTQPSGSTTQGSWDPIHFYAADKKSLRNERKKACIKFYKDLKPKGIDLSREIYPSKNGEKSKELYDLMKDMPDNLEVIGVTSPAIAANATATNVLVSDEA